MPYITREEFVAMMGENLGREIELDMNFRDCGVSEGEFLDAIYSVFGSNANMSSVRNDLEYNKTFREIYGSLFL